MRRPALLLIVLCLVLAPAILAAFPVPPADPAGIGRGGASVAAGAGLGAVLLNPAALTRAKTLELVIPSAGLRADDHLGVLDKMEEMDDILGGKDINSWALSAYAAADTASLGRMRDLILSLAEPGKNSVDVAGAAQAGVSLKAFGLALGVSYGDLFYASAVTKMDTENLVYDPLDPDFLADNIADNASSLDLVGIEGRQLILTAAKDVGLLSLGANLRMVKGKGYLTSLLATTGDASDQIDFDTLSESEVETSATALDAGVQLQLLPILRGGLAGTNLNSPEFDLPGGRSVTIDPKVRAGVQLDLPVLDLAADVDLTETESLTSGAKYRDASLGAEFDLWLLKVRAGMSRNLAVDGAPTLFHGGVGIDLPGLKLDLGGAIDSEQEHSQVGLSLAIKL